MQDREVKLDVKTCGPVQTLPPSFELKVEPFITADDGFKAFRREDVTKYTIVPHNGSQLVLAHHKDGDNLIVSRDLPMREACALVKAIAGELNVWKQVDRLEGNLIPHLILITLDGTPIKVRSWTEPKWFSEGIGCLSIRWVEGSFGAGVDLGSRLEIEAVMSRFNSCHCAKFRFKAVVVAKNNDGMAFFKSDGVIQEMEA